MGIGMKHNVMSYVKWLSTISRSTRILKASNPLGFFFQVFIGSALLSYRALSSFEKLVTPNVSH